MFRIPSFFLLLLISTTLLASDNSSHNSESPGNNSKIEVSQPWTRATPPGAGAGGGFITLTNHGDQNDRLVSASSTITNRTEIHTMEMDGDVMRMMPLLNGINIPPGSTVILKPGGLHLMFLELSGSIVEGTFVPVTLEFEHSPSVDVELRVLAAGTFPENKAQSHSGH
ncbi:copper chaperone PCu(A)C [Vreelandella titanicae]|uniref:copper chaperone PCu(A)C n=1 Tax=Vreelandella titanicae TaxID=664683 RepID=UPI003BB1F8F3